MKIEIDQSGKIEEAIAFATQITKITVILNLFQDPGRLSGFRNKFGITQKR